MNTEIANHLPRIADFPFLQASFLEKFSAVYTPDMSVAEVKCCQKYYLKNRRVPKNADELAFLNAFVSQNYRKPSAFLISEMKTDDEFLATTFADLMAKRTAVFPDYRMPCSFAEILEIAQKYLAAHEKRASVLDMLAFSCEKSHMLALAAAKAEPTLLVGDIENGLSGGTRISHALACHAPLSQGDKVYAFLKSTDPTENFEEKLLSFATSAPVVSRAKALCRIDGCGVLETLMGLDMGFEVELSRLYGERPCAIRLLEEDVGLLVIARSTEVSDILMDALDIGLRPRIVGELRKDGLIHLKETKEDHLSFSLNFLKELCFSRAYHTEMKPDTAPPALSISDCTAKTVGKSSLLLAHVKGEDSRHAALYAALYAVSALVARGAELRDIRIAHRFDLSLSNISTKSLGRQLALLLGLYRAIAELELHTLSSATLACGEPSSSFALYALAQKPTNTLPDMLVHTDSRIYLLEPLYDGKGNPDFEDYKKMLEYVGELQKSGKILSARAVLGDVLPALEKMSGDTLVEYLPRETCIAKAGAILIETRESIQGTLLAKACKPEESENSALFSEEEGKEDCTA